MKKLIVAAVLAAAAQAAWADLSTLENTEQTVAIAAGSGDINNAHSLAAKPFDGIHNDVTGGATVAGKENAGEKKGLNISAVKNVPLASEVPTAKEETGSLKNFLKNEDASARGDGAALMLLILILGALIVPAAIGYVVANGLAATVGASGTVATAIKVAGAAIGMKLGYDWFKKK